MSDQNNQATDPTIIRVQPHDPNQFKRASALLDAAKTYVIDCDEIYDCAAEDLKAIKALQKDLDEKRKSITKPMDEAKKAVMELFRGPTDYLEQAESILKKQISRWLDAKEKARVAALREAEKAAAAERQALEQQAQKAAEAGDTATMAALEMQAAVTSVAAPLPDKHKTSGISSRKVHKGNVIDAKALISHVLTNETLFAMGIVEINQGALNKYISSTEGKIALPGVENTTDTNIAARAA
jgi:hypothetical protein